MAPADLFPPEGHRYFTDDHIEALREKALDGGDVTLPALMVLELVCDWRNMAAELERAEQRTDAERGLLSSKGDVNRFVARMRTINAATLARSVPRSQLETTIAHLRKAYVQAVVQEDEAAGNGQTKAPCIHPPGQRSKGHCQLCGAPVVVFGVPKR